MKIHLVFEHLEHPRPAAEVESLLREADEHPGPSAEPAATESACSEDMEFEEEVTLSVSYTLVIY